MLKDVIYMCRHNFRRWVRERTAPMSVEEAEEKRLFWSKMYAFSTLTFLMYCTYHVYQNPPVLNKSDDVPQELSSSFIFTTDKPLRYVKFEGFNKVRDVTYLPEELDLFIEKKPNKYTPTEDPANSDTN